jgi:putative heme-binding domain-containing protein
VQALAAHPKAEVARLLLEAWPSAGPTLRREMSVALFARPERTKALLDAIEKKTVLPVQLEPARLAQLRKSPRGAKLLAGAVVPARAKVVESYREALKLEGDAARGKMVFAKNCATCHRLESVGVQVGADLLAALRTKTAEALLIDVLDPSREVDPRYLAYNVRTKRGLTLTGIVSADTATSMTLKRGEAAEDTVLRNQIEAVESTGKSLMPDGLEMQIGKQDLADLIRYLLGVK